MTGWTHALALWKQQERDAFYRTFPELDTAETLLSTAQYLHGADRDRLNLTLPPWPEDVIGLVLDVFREEWAACIDEFELGMLLLGVWEKAA